MLTMLLGGLWHGAAWTFVAWGAIHGVGLAAERWWKERPGYVRAAAHRRCARGWRASRRSTSSAWPGSSSASDSFELAWEMITGLFTGWGEASPLVTGGVLLAIAVGIGSQYLPARVPQLIMARFGRLPRARTGGRCSRSRSC